jgi:hypothetical protein
VERAAGVAKAVERALDGGADFGVEAFAEVLLGNADAQLATGCAEAVASIASGPASTSSIVAASAMFFVNGPIRSSELANAISP